MHEPLNLTLTTSFLYFRMNTMEDEYEDEDDDDEEDVEEVKDSSSDSDIMEVDAEDNSIDPLSISRSPKFNGEKEKGSTGSVGKTNVVTIDDMKTLKALADSAKANTFQNEKGFNKNIYKSDMFSLGMCALLMCHPSLLLKLKV